MEKALLNVGALPSGSKWMGFFLEQQFANPRRRLEVREGIGGRSDNPFIESLHCLLVNKLQLRNKGENRIPSILIWDTWHSRNGEVSRGTGASAFEPYVEDLDFFCLGYFFTAILVFLVLGTCAARTGLTSSAKLYAKQNADVVGWAPVMLPKANVVLELKWCVLIELQLLLASSPPSLKIIRIKIGG